MTDDPPFPCTDISTRQSEYIDLSTIEFDVADLSFIIQSTKKWQKPDIYSDCFIIVHIRLYLTF